MALRGDIDDQWFHPGKFLKPPFHIYLNFFLAYKPAKVLAGIFNISREATNTIILVWSRALTVLLFSGSVVLLYLLGRQFFGQVSGRIISMLYATSAGFVAFSHFLTADIPVMFWMLAAFYFAAKILLEPACLYYVLTGLLTGIAAATKYNGLAIGVAIPIAHVLSHFDLETSPFKVS